MPVPSALLPAHWPQPKPAQVAMSLRNREGLVWLDSATRPVGATAQPAWSYLAHSPTRVLEGHIDRDWQQISECLRQHGSPGVAADNAVPMTSGLLGWVGFDGRYRFGLYEQMLAYSHKLGSWFGSDQGELAAMANPSQPPAQAASELPSHRQLAFAPLVEREDFIRAVERAQAYIAAGDVYQVNLAYPWRAHWPAEADALACYLRLREVSPAPYAAYLDLGGTRVLSSSPECFLRFDGRRILTRPIKGTRPRFPRNPRRDLASRHELVTSAKEQAELLMITDLERNDLGQICDFGSVGVNELAVPETFAQVFHLVSSISGQLREDIDPAAAFRACFPGGSISGAPKKRALEIIAELEPHSRGLYTGAIGAFGFQGHSQFSIAIRTAVQEGQHIGFHVGAGIVADSVPELEHEETLHKAAGLLML